MLPSQTLEPSDSLVLQRKILLKGFIKTILEVKYHKWCCCISCGFIFILNYNFPLL